MLYAELVRVILQQLSWKQMSKMCNDYNGGGDDDRRRSDDDNNGVDSNEINLKYNSLRGME